MPRILITGGAGMIGQEIARQLAKEEVDGKPKWEIDIFDDLSNPWTKQNGVGFWPVGTIKEILKKYDYDVISHHASMVSVGKSMYDPETCFRQNVQFTAELIQAMIESNYKGKIILASSMGVYGNGTGPCSYYGLSKKYQEDMLLMYHATYGGRLAILRYFSVYGMQTLENPFTGILSIIINQIKTSGKVEMYEDGLQTRDMVHVADVASFHNGAIDYLDKLSLYQSDVSTGTTYTMVDIVAMVQEALGTDCPVVFNGKKRAGDIRLVDSKRTLGNHVRLRDGIAQYIEYLKTQPEPRPTVMAENYHIEEKGLVR